MANHHHHRLSCGIPPLYLSTPQEKKSLTRLFSLEALENATSQQFAREETLAVAGEETAAGEESESEREREREREKDSKRGVAGREESPDERERTDFFFFDQTLRVPFSIPWET